MHQTNHQVEKGSQPAANPEPQEAHAAAGSLEAVIEAQNALSQEGQHQQTSAATEEERQAQRRKSVFMISSTWLACAWQGAVLHRGPLQCSLQ